MTIQEASKQLLFQLYHLYNDREAANIADWVMENITGWKKIDRIIHKTVPLSSLQQATLTEYTNKLLDHTPMQYVLEECWFYGLKLFVNKNVLIPRPETEELVDWIAQDAKKAAATHVSTILDIGTGSGCIALALKKAMPEANIHACDISAAALDVAQRNAETHQLQVSFSQVNFLDEHQRNALPVFDIVVSNPPYIPLADKHTMQPNVLLHEPHTALFVNHEDPLIFYSAIAGFSAKHLATNGYLYVETHELRAEAVAAVFHAHQFKNIVIKKDMQEKTRMVKAARA